MELSHTDLMVFGIATLTIMIYQGWFYMASSDKSDRLNSTQRVGETVAVTDKNETTEQSNCC